MQFSRRLAVVFAMVLGFVFVSGPAAQAAYYNTYSNVASTPDVGGATGAQGFAAGATYLYSIKTRTGAYDRSVIYRVNKSTGSKVVMTTGGSPYNNWLDHGNDMTIVDIDGKHYFFVVTLKSTGAQLVKIQYDGTTYKKVASYSVKLGSAVKAVSGISRVAIVNGRVTFLFKSGSTIYNGSVATGATSGTVALTTAFTLKVSGAKVDGSTISDLSSFSDQGFYYNEAKKVLYYPLTKDNRSVVLVYRNVSGSTRGSVTSASDLSFRITSKTYSKFEIEGLGLSGGKLYFNTNRATSKAAADGVHVFNGYTG